MADVLKTASKRAIQKTAEATGDLIGNAIADKIMKSSKTSQQNNSETIYLSKTITENYWWYEINVIVWLWNIKK